MKVTIKPMIQVLTKLVNVHKSLLENARQKTEVVKEGSVEQLQMILVKERKYIQVLEQAEAERKKEVENWFLQQGLPLNNATITEILDHIPNNEEKKELENQTVALTEMITSLKQQEQLNQALIQQSMQFVQLSLDMMNPSIKNMNYGNKQETSTEKRSVFDSKA